MMSKRQYQSAFEDFKAALMANPHLTMTAYARKRHISISGLSHYVNDDLHLTVKQIKAEVLGARTTDVPAGNPSFVEVIPESPLQDGKIISIELHFPSGVRMTINDGGMSVVNALIDKLNTTV